MVPVLMFCFPALGGFIALTFAMNDRADGAAAPERTTAREPAHQMAGDARLSVDLRPLFDRWNLPPRLQAGRGTCSVFAVVGGLEFAVAKKQGKGTRLSVEFLNWAAHTAVNRTADGGFFSELWTGFESYGICPEEDLPYRDRFDASLRPPGDVLARARKMRLLRLRLHWIKEWDTTTGLTADQLTAIKHTLEIGWPVCGGFRWPKQPEWDDGVLRLCQPEEVFDGHSVLLVGYRDDSQQPGGGVFLIRNSGGDGRGACLSYKYVCEYMNDSVWIDE